MANVSAHKTLTGWSDRPETSVLTYDFGNDAGATGTFNLGTFDGAHVITRATVHVETAVTSASTPAISLGIGTGGSSAVFLDSAAKGTLVDNYVAAGTVPQHAADADVIVMDLKTATLTAGKIHLHLEYQKAP